MVVFPGLVLAGAGGTSNLIDRVNRQGFVTDFLLLRIGPLQTGIFNVADFMIMLGLALTVCSLGTKPAKQISVKNADG